MEKIHQRPSILVRDLYANAAERESRTFLSYPNQETNFDGPRSWFRYTWTIVCELFVYWKLLSYVPFDLVCGNFTTDLVSILEDTPTFLAAGSPESTADQKDVVSNLGQIALHPTLPLLAVVSSRSPEILFYNTKTSKYLWNYRVAPNGTTEVSWALEGGNLTSSADFPYVTCLRFSEGSRLAAGLSNGTVHYMEQNLSRMMEIVPTPGEVCITPVAHPIKLLPIKDANLYTKSVGRTTNLAFSPKLQDQEEAVWLAIATERSGIWMWNQRSRQTLRAISTGGISEHCLHWISIEEKYTPRPNTGEPAVRREKRLDQSEMAKWHKILGDVEDISALDGCFSSHSNKSSSDHGSIQGPIITEHKNSLLMSAHSTLPPTAQSQKGKSLLICGALDGRVWAQNLWHSEMMMQVEKSSKFHLSDVAESNDRPKSIYGPVNGPITHISVHALECTLKSVKISITAACEDDGTSIVYAFNLSLALSPDEATGAAVSMVNMQEPSKNRLRGVLDWLSPSKRRARWLEDLHVSTYDAQPIWLMTDSYVEMATLISTSSLSNASLLLTTLRPRRDIAGGSLSSQCMLFAHNPQSTSTALEHVAQIRPLLPMPAGFAHHQENSRQEATNKGYYTNMLERAGIDSRTLGNPPIGVNKNDELARACEQVIDCGQVAWGKGRYGRDLGAFLYKPGSLLDDGLGIALFEL